MVMQREVVIGLAEELLAIVRDAIQQNIKTHGVAPERNFEALNALAFVVATVLAGAPPPDRERVRMWFIETLDEATADARNKDRA